MDYITVTIEQLAGAGVLIFLIGCAVGAVAFDPKEKQHGSRY